MDIKFCNSLIDSLIKEDPDNRIKEYLKLLKEINNIEMNDFNFTSPIVRMPFGKHKGRVFWTLGPSYFNWLSKQPHTSATARVIEEATQLYEQQGAFAIMRRDTVNKYITELVTIKANKRAAEVYYEEKKGWTYFLYPIQDRTEEERKIYPQGYFPDIEDFEYKSQN